MSDSDRTSRSTEDGRTDDFYLTPEFVERALSQFPSEGEPVLVTRPHPQGAEGFKVPEGQQLFERHRARWSARAYQEPDLSVLLVKPDRKGYRRALAAAVVVAVCASLIAFVTRPSLFVNSSSSSSRPVHVSEMSARQPVAAVAERQIVAEPAERQIAADPAEHPSTPAKAPTLSRANLRVPPERPTPIRASRTFAMPAAERAASAPSPEAIPTAMPVDDAPSSPLLVTSSSTPIATDGVRLDRAPVAAIDRPAAASAAATVAANTVAIDDRQAIHQVVGRYAAAFTRLDATAAEAVWPQVNRRALERGFSQIERQTVALGNCNVSMRGSQATAQCRGRATYVPKVGNRTERTEDRTWTFDLQKTGNSWVIAGVESK